MKRVSVLLLSLVLLLCAAGLAFSMGDSSASQPHFPNNDLGGSYGDSCDYDYGGYDFSGYDYGDFDYGGADDGPGGTDDDFVAGEVLAPAESWEQALEIAAAYGLELKSYAWGVAVLVAPDPEQAVADSVAAIAAAAHSQSTRALLPELSLNHIYYIEEVAEDYLVDHEYDEYDIGRTWELYDATPYGEAQWHHEFMDSGLAWDITKGEGVVVAILDTGIDINHPKFVGKILPSSYNSYTDQIGLSFVNDDHERGHGTHVSGIVAASMEGDTSVCGVAPGATILTVKTNLPGTGKLTSESWVRGLNYAVENGANVVNMSFGRDYSPNGGNEIEQNAIVNAVAKGVVIVCAAGNSSLGHAGYPGAYPEAIAVAALEPSGLLASFSNYGPELGVAAPGRNIYSTCNSDEYVNLSGTSMASPCVAGVVALVKSLHPNYSVEQIRNDLYQTARKASPAEKDERYGYGLVNAYAALLGEDSLCAITFNYNDGVRAPITIKSARGVKLVKPDYPLRDGYVFGGWFTSLDGGDEFNFSTRISESMSLFAKWGISLPGMFSYEIPDPALCQTALNWVNQDGANKNPMSIMTTDDIIYLEQCTSVYLSDMGVKTLKGIEYFTGLTSLNVSKNILAEIDLYNNKQIKTLDCSENRLTALDMSENLKLTDLDCSKNLLTKLYFPNTIWNLYCSWNLLTELDTTKFTNNLRWLSCDNNLLTKLDLPGRYNFQNLRCNDNRLTELNLANNRILLSVHCQNNMLTKLDLTNDPQLIYLYCYNNRLTALDISASFRLVRFQCSNNWLTKLDVSNSPLLATLSCSYNYIKSRDDVIGWELHPYLKYPGAFLFSPQYTGKPPTGEEITQAFKDVNFLAVIREITGKFDEPIFDYDVSRLTDLRISSKNISNLAGIEYFTNLTRLDCQNNLLTELDLSANIALTNLFCNDNLLARLDVSQSTKLTRIDCFRNRFTELDVSNNTALYSFDCTYNDMKTVDDIIGWEKTPLRYNANGFKFYPQNGQINAETPVIAKQPESITVSQGGTAILTVEAEVAGGILSYQWYRGTMFEPMPISGAISASYDLPTDIIGSYVFHCEIINTDDAATGAKTALVRSNTARVIVTSGTLIHAETPNITSSPTNKTVNIGETAALSVAATVSKGTLSYQWYSNTSKTNSGGTIITGATSVNYNAPTVTAGTSYYYCTVTNTDNEATGNKTATTTTSAVQVTTILLGDINGDGRINLSDLSFLAQYFIGGYGIEERFPMIYTIGDMNRNGELELDDLDLLAYRIINVRPVTAINNGQMTAIDNGQLIIDNEKQIEAQSTIMAAFDMVTPADDKVTVITVPAFEGKPGERVVVPVAIENSPGVKMYQLAMQYDNTKLEFISQSSGSAFAQAASLRNGGPIQVDGDIWEARVTYLGELLAPQTVSGDVILCEFEFEIRDGADGGATPLTLKPQNSYILDGSGNNVYPQIKNGAITIEATAETESYNFRAYMEAAQTNLKAGDTLSVDIMLSGDFNYTQFNAAIAYDAALLEFAGYANLGGLVAEVKKDGADKITVRSVASLNMLTGATCVTPVRVVTLKFTVKDTLAAESIATDLNFTSIAVTPAAGVSGVTVAPGRVLRVTLSR